MELGQIVREVRDFYVSHFIDELNKHGADASIVHEPAFCDAQGELVVDGKLELPVRGDILVMEDGQVVDSIQIDTEEMLAYEPVEFTWPDELQVDLQPFQWNWIQLRIYGLTADADWSPLRDWFIRWFQEGDPPQDEVLGGVHFMSDPADIDGHVQISMDMGTAPAESFEELLNSLGQLGAARVEVGQFEDEAVDEDSGEA